MNTDRVAAYLRAIAEILKPFTSPPPLPGELTWNGTSYVASSEDRMFDPYALSWWGTLSTIADLLEMQGVSITDAQREYLKRLLFGGMGSLNDYMLDKHFGQTAHDANVQLDKIKERMFEEFRNAHS